MMDLWVLLLSNQLVMRQDLNFLCKTYATFHQIGTNLSIRGLAIKLILASLFFFFPLLAVNG